MTEGRYTEKLSEVDHLINDPSMPLCPARIWQLMEEISGHAETEVDHERRPLAAWVRVSSPTSRII